MSGAGSGWGSGYGGGWSGSWQTGGGQGYGNWQSGSKNNANWQSGTNQGANWQSGSGQGGNWQSGEGQSGNWQSKSGQGNDWRSGNGKNNQWQYGGAQGNNWQTGGGQGNNWQSGSGNANNWQNRGGYGNAWQSGYGQNSAWQMGGGQGQGYGPQYGNGRGNNWQTGGGDWQYDQGNNWEYDQGNQSHNRRQPWHKGQGGSASGYSYLHKNKNNPQTSEEVEDENKLWDNYVEDQPMQKWSTNADDEDWGYEQSIDGPNPSGMDYQGGPGGRGGRGSRRKRRNNDNGARFGKRRQRDYGWNDYGGYGEGGWGYGGYDDGYGEWGQHHRRGQGWGVADDFYNEEGAYDYGGYEGGYDDPENYYPGDHRGWRRDDRQNSRRSGPRNETEDDKLIYRKHRTLTQINTVRRSLNGVVKCVMNAMKTASEILSKEATSIAETENADTADTDTAEDNGTAEKEAADTDTAEDNGTAEKEAVDTEAEKLVIEAEDTDGVTNLDETSEAEKTNILETSEPVADSKTEFIGPVKPGEKEAAVEPLPTQVLLGVVKVGPVARKLLTKKNTNMGPELVAVFKNYPTKHQLRRLASLLEENMKESLASKMTYQVDEVKEVINITVDPGECPYPITISCTSPECGHDYEGEKSKPHEDDLSEKSCLTALAKIRRVRWARTLRDDIELPITRIFLDFASRVSGWQHLQPYATEVLVHTVMDKLARDIRESEHTFSRLFVQCLEVLAGGLLLSCGPGMKDPCEAQSVDVFAYLEPQQAEELTAAAQSALRFMACERLRELLEVDLNKD